MLTSTVGSIDGLCGAAQVDGFTCPGYNTFFSSAVQWGAIGPARLYSEGRIYYPLVYGFVAGAITPFVPYYFSHKYPNSIWKFVSVPVIWVSPTVPIAFRRHRLTCICSTVR
jgi:hypothetical protein